MVYRIYFSAPLFSQAEKDFNEKIVKLLEDIKEDGKQLYQVFLPQRDGFEAARLQGLRGDDKAKKIFEKDISEVENADILFMVTDGYVPDDGACVELGYAYAKGKRCYALSTDGRSFMKDMTLNPLLTGCFLRIFKSVEELKDFLKKNKL